VNLTACANHQKREKKKKRAKNNVVNLLSQMKSPENWIAESQAEKEEPESAFWERFLCLLTFGKCASAIIHFFFFNRDENDSNMKKAE